MKRREFLKKGSVGLLALSTGYAIGDILYNEKSNDHNQSFYAFLPNNKNILMESIRLIKDGSNNKELEILLMKREINTIVKKRFFSEDQGIFSSSFYDIRLIRCKDNIMSDIFISSANNLVFDPGKDFNERFLELRNSVSGTKSHYLLSIEKKKRNYISDFIFDDKKILTIRNENGLYDKIDLLKNYSSIFVPGKNGNINISVKNGKAHIKSVPCLNKLCKFMSHSSNNSTIACVPNKILLEYS